MTKAILKVRTPKCELQWVTISGKGKEDLQGRLKYKADAILDPNNAEHQEFMDKIDDFWEENKPKGHKLKSKVYKPELRKTDQVDEDGVAIKEETGRFIATFKTDTIWPDGKPKTIQVYNAKAAKVSLGSKEVGNGSIGRISGAIDIYSTKAKEAGVTAYLNGIQIVKLEEASMDDGFEADEDEADGWDGDDFEGEDLDADDSTPAATPRL